MAERANLYDLYEASVQDPPDTVKLLRSIAKENGCPRPRKLREDFCGTGAISAAWCALGREYAAIGYDADPSVLVEGERRYGRYKRLRFRRHAFGASGKSPGSERSDVVFAFNYAINYMKDRASLLNYLRSALSNLTENGVSILDGWNGPGVVAYREERSACVPGVRYLWEVESYDHVSGRTLASVSYRFKDRSELPRAFVCDWRLWQPQELIESAYEVGAKRVKFYLESYGEAVEAPRLFRSSGTYNFLICMGV
jgi:hypothetical protein